MVAGDSINNGAGVPNCTSDLDIAVQVTGLLHKKEHSQYQCLKLKHNGNTYDPCSIDEENKKTAIPSTLFKWSEDCYKAGSTSLILSIATRDNPIELTLTESFNNQGSTMSVDNYYLTNRIYAVVPFTNMAIIQNGNRTSDARNMDLTQNFLTVRAGYIYIFNNGKLWRELFCSQNEAGTNIFEDIDVAAYRNEDGSYKSEMREPKGLGITDIWLPGAFVATAAPNLQLMYSDVPLSAERITYLESNDKHRNKRTTAFKWDTELTTKHESGSLFPSQRDAGQHKIGAFPLTRKYFPRKTRGRDELTERQFDNPVKYLTREQYTVNVFKNSTHKDPIRSHNPHDKVESGAILYNVLSQKAKLSEQEQEKMAVLTEIWQTPKPFVDCIEPIKSRGIWAVLVEDANYIVSHRLDRFDDITLLFNALAEKAANEPYHKLARFIEKQRGIAQINKGVSSFSGAGKERYDKATSLSERQCLYKILRHFRTTIFRAFKELPMAETLADMLSNWNNAFDLSGHYNYLARSLSIMTQPNENFDPLAYGSTHIRADYHNSPDKFVLDIFTDTTQIINQMLWPNVRPEDIEKEFEDYPETPNRGDGLFNPTIWQKIISEDALKSVKPTVYNGITFVATHHYAQTPNPPWQKTTITSLWGILSELESTIERVKETSTQNNELMIILNRELAEAESKYGRLYAELTEKATTHEQLNSQLASLENEIANKKRAIAALKEELLDIFERSPIIKLRTHLGQAQVMRLFSAGYLKQMVWKMLAHVPYDGKLESGWRILGVVDNNVGGTRPVTDINKGKITTDDGTTAKIQSNKSGGAPVRYFAALPENHPHVLRSDQIKNQLLPDIQACLQADLESQQLVRGRLEELIPQKEQVRQQTNASQTKVDSVKQQIRDGQLSLITRSQVNNMSALERLQRGYQKVANSGVMPPMLLVWEVYNLNNVWSMYEKTINDRGIIKTGADILTAGGGVGVALLAVVEQLYISHYAANKLGTPSLTNFLNKEVIYFQKLDKFLRFRAFPVGILAIVGIGTSISDIVTGIARKDQGFAFSSIFSLAGGIASLISIGLGESGVLMGLGAIGWMFLALGLSLLGIFILFKFGDTPLEKWFHMGPFSGYQHQLLEPEVKAFAALINILFPPSVTVMNNPFRQESRTLVNILRNRGISEQSEQFKAANAMAEANTCITVASHLKSVLKQDCSIKFEGKVYQRRLTADITNQQGTISQRYSSTLNECAAGKILHSQQTSEGLLIFAYTPQDTQHQPQQPSISRGLEIFNDGYENRSSTDFYLWFIAVQLQAKMVLDEQEVLLAVPAPSFEENKTYDAERHGEPHFISGSSTKNDSVKTTFRQDFWFKEIYSTGKITL